MKAWTVFIAGANGFIAVSAGAFAAHGLKGRVDERALAAFETGAEYHLVHAVALLALGLLTGPAMGERPLKLASLFFLAGIVLFSGSLYYLGLTESRALVLVTPVGGVCFLLGWLSLAWAGWRMRKV